MKELDLFNRLKETLYPKLVKTSNEFATFDCVDVVSNSYIELKCRKTHYNNLLIEKGKYDRLKNISDKTGKRILYINSTPNGIYSWDLTDMNIKWEEKSGLPVTTEFENKNKIMKIVGYLDTNNAKILNIESLDII